MSHRIGRISKIRFGFGEGTTRRQWSPSALTVQPLSAASASASALLVDRADELRGIVEGRIVGVDLDHRQDRRQAEPQRQEVAELLLDEVADHPLRLGAEDVERVRLDLGVGSRLERQEPDLGAVAVRDDELVIAGDAGEALSRDADVGPLGVCRHRFAALEQRVAPEGHHDLHDAPPLALVSRRRWRP